jgi:hypothetical protein
VAPLNLEFQNFGFFSFGRHAADYSLGQNV